jgi:hypothetical protein
MLTLDHYIAHSLHPGKTPIKYIRPDCKICSRYPPITPSHLRTWHRKCQICWKIRFSTLFTQARRILCSSTRQQNCESRCRYMLTDRYSRGWRYHTELQLWLTGPSLTGVEGMDPALAVQSSPRWARGPFMYFDPRTFGRNSMPEEFAINLNLIEATRPAQVVIGEARARAARGHQGEEGVGLEEHEGQGFGR